MRLFLCIKLAVSLLVKKHLTLVPPSYILVVDNWNAQGLCRMCFSCIRSEQHIVLILWASQG